MTREEAIRFGENILKVADETTDADAIEFTEMAIKAFAQVPEIGHWIYGVTPRGEKVCRCSNCDYPVPESHAVMFYCSNCGARMRGSKDSIFDNRKTT